MTISFSVQGPRLQPELCRLPLLIGVTGHRDLPEWARESVGQSVRSLLQAAKKDYGAEMPIAVITSLAKGADQLVAEIALELDLGIRAILPFSPEHLEVDDPAAQATLQRILAHPNTEATNLSSFPELEAAFAGDAVQHSVRADQLRYEQAGLVVARHSHILLALVHPDEVTALSPRREFRRNEQAALGGSRRIVEFWITGRLVGGAVARSPLAPEGSLLRPVLTGPLVHIATPRESKEESSETLQFTAGAVTAILPAHAEMDRISEESSHARFITRFFGEETEILGLLMPRQAITGSSWYSRTFVNIWGIAGSWDPQRLAVLPRIGRFNAIVSGKSLGPGPGLMSSIKKSLTDLIDERRLKQLVFVDSFDGSSSQEFALARQRHLFAGSHGLANLEHELLKRNDKFILSAVPLSVFLFEVFEEFYRSYWLLAAYVAIFLIAFVLYSIIRYQDLQDRYQDSRLLGEAARVQFFWSLAGLPYSVADEYQANELGDGSWLYPAIKSVALEGLTLAQTSNARDFVLTNWLGAPLSLPDEDVPDFTYRKWYHKSAMRYRRGYKTAGRWRWGLFGCGYALAIGTIFLLFFGHEHSWWGHEEWMKKLEQTLIVLIPTIPAIGAVLVLWRERRAYEVHAHEYHRMNLLVREGLRLLARHTGDPKWEAQVLHAIGQEALHEVTRWLVAHRSQPVHPVPG
jgi:hypothetical protein